jgi:hypothetical protein
MKTLYKKLLYASSGTMLCLFLAAPASAQHSSNNSGSSSSSGSRSSGSSNSSGTSSGSSSRSSGGSSVSYRPSSAGSNNFRSSGGIFQRGSTGQQRPAYVYRQGLIVRNSVGYASRPGISAVGGNSYFQRAGVNAANVSYAAERYNAVPRIAYVGGSYWGAHDYYHYNRGGYNTIYKPKLGYRCKYLVSPYAFTWADEDFFYDLGLFYAFDDGEYTVVEPPIGAEVTALPDSAQSIVINGKQYYECNGVYYQPVTKDNGTVVYMVAGKDGVLNTNSTIQDDEPKGPQLGDVVNQLPSNCRKININGQKIFVSPDGVYYLQKVDGSGNIFYKVIGLPSDENDQNSNI